MSATETKQYEYYRLIRRYFELSKEKSGIETNRNEWKLKKNEKYARLNEQIAMIETRLDDLTNEFDNEDFRKVFRRIEK